MRVYIPSPLRSYTGQKDQATAEGLSLDELLRDLNARYPGIRFRIVDEQDQIRRHIKIFTGREQAHSVSAELPPDSEVTILCALSGGCM